MAVKTILIIDTDTKTLHNKITSKLKSEGYLVFTASGKDVSITTAKKLNPALIFINIGMSSTSGLNGLEICKAVHGSETLKSVPIILITPRGGTIDSRYTSIYGIVDFLKKPFRPEELISKTKNVLAAKSVHLHPVEEEVTTAQPEGEIDVKLFEEERITAEPIKEEIEVQPVEEEIELGKGKEPIPLEEKMPASKKEITEEIVSDKTDVKQMMRELDEKKPEHVTCEELEETLVNLILLSKGRDSTSMSGKSERRRNKKNRLFVPIIILVVIGIAGIVLHGGLRQGTKVQLPVVMPSNPVQQQTAKVEPSQEEQKPQQVVEESKPALPSAPEAQPEGKPAYSVQIGVFKNEANAVALTKKYEEKGYDAFTHKSTTKDKGILYRVLIGEFEERKEASKFFYSIHAKENINVTIFHE